MKINRKHLAALFGVGVCLLSSVIYGEEDVYYCVEANVKGFQYFDQNQENVRPQFSDDGFAMQLNRDAKRIDLTYPTGGRESFGCKNPYTHLPFVMSCIQDHGLSHFNFNSNNGRFAYFSGDGYVAHDLGLIAASYGKCEPVLAGENTANDQQ